MLRQRVWGLALATVMAVTALGASAQAQEAPRLDPRVIGGVDATAADVPWQVLFIIDNSSVCGGSLVSPTKIVSAAHCFVGKPVASVNAWIGISKMSDRSAATQLEIASITNHPDFNPQTYADDIAVVTLATPVRSSSGTATIALPSKVDPNTWPTAGTTVTVSGWGETSPTSSAASDQLQAAPVVVLASPGSDVCGDYGSTYLASVQICAGETDGGVDACEGDSGGPLTAVVDDQPVLAGISSTGFECAAAGFPGLYVRVTTYLPWLAQQGIDINAGSQSLVTAPGLDRDGVPANFRVGQTYPRAVFAEFAKLSTKRSKLTVTGGAACTQVKQAVRIDGPGKCRILIAQGKSRVPIVVTVYSS